MTLELSEDIIMQLLEDTLLTDYKILTNEIADTKMYKGLLQSCDLKELKRQNKARKAMKVVLEYYIGSNWKESL